jgi:transcriptional regulator with XRE-family HTH domain
MSKSDASAVKEFREQLGITQAALGEMLGMKAAVISHWETGRRQLPEHIAIRLSRLRHELEETAAGSPGQTHVIGEARMSDGELTLFPWDASTVTVPTPIPDSDLNLRAVILVDEGRNIEINGWLAFFPLSSTIQCNILSIIKLKDDEGFCGFIRKGKKGRLYVESFFGERVIENIEVKACYPITWMKAPAQGDDI